MIDEKIISPCIDLHVNCYECGVILNKENYRGWYKIIEQNDFTTCKVPVCDVCIQSDDGSDSEGAY